MFIVGIRLPQSSLTLRRLAARLLLVVGLVTAPFCSAMSEQDIAQLRQLAQLAEYIGVDYSGAVANGVIINDGEYSEMAEFGALLVDKTSDSAHPATIDPLIAEQARALQAAIGNKADPQTVSELGAELRASLLALMPQLLLPRQLLPEAEVTALFQENCSACHGMSGHGDGPMAAQLAPTPTNFQDKQRANNRSLLGLFDAISNGIADTAMPSFTQFKAQQRWSLAFYVGSLAYQAAPVTATTDAAISLQQLVNISPGQLMASLPAQRRAAVESLRANPQQLFAQQSSPLSVAREHLNEAISAHQQGDYNNAVNLAVSAYLDGFELVESSLDTRDPELRKVIEVNMMNLRHLLSKPQLSGELDQAMALTLQQLDDAEQLMNGSTLSATTLFTASFVILLREGLEALLVVIALITVLVKTHRRDALKYVHLGWIGALLAGGATWLAARSLISISGAGREVMEGGAALLASVVLFYVGIWMHSKTHAAHWQAYIQRHINSHLTQGTLWGLAGLSFIAVYREVFETVLFYEALLTQATVSQYGQVVGGLLGGVVSLALIAWVLIRFSVKLPIGKFFSSTTYLLLALSFVLMGKGIAALQEASVVAISPLPFSFEFDWMGIKSTWQGVLAQAAILLVFLIFMTHSRKKAASLQNPVA